MTRTVSTRERRFLIVGGVIVAAILLYVGGVESYRGVMGKLDRTIAGRNRQLAEVVALRGEVRTVREQMREAEGRLARSGDFSLVRFTEDLAGRVAGRGALIHARPQPAAVHGEFREELLEARFERLTLEQLLRLLWEIDNAPVPLRVQTLQLRKRADAPAQLDLTLLLGVTRRTP